MNLLTLFGLVLAIGIVVDDAIVVVENVQRWVDEGVAPREAAVKSMHEVTPAVIAIAFGLSAVFIPVAFISGITGQFYRQFALTIAFSTLLSAFNSLTLSPALSALLLRPREARQDLVSRALNSVLGWLFRLFNRGLDGATHAYVAVVRRLARAGVLVLLVYGGLLYLTYLGFKAVPTGFIPPQDAGYLIVNLQMPDAASINRTSDALGELVQIARASPGVHDTVSIGGYSVLTGSNSSAAGAMFVILDPFEKRVGKPELTARTIGRTLETEMLKVEEGFALVFPPPPVRGIGNSGGFKLMIEDRSGEGSPQQLQAVIEDVIDEVRKPQNSQVVSNPFTSFRASVPQLYANLDRTKAKQQDVSVTDIFQALQVYLGSLYVNDFNFLGRTYRVMAQADAPYRAQARDVAQFKTRNAAGEMVPLGAVMDIKDIIGPDRVQRYNLYLAAEINGTTAPGRSSGEAIELMQRVSSATMPQGYTAEWTELAYQESIAGNTALFIFPLCVLFVWLTHSAEYESFALSTAIILIVPMCLLCGIAAVWMINMDNNIFTQIGFVVLAGMSVKNAVLIIEFAKQQQEHDPRMSATDAVVEAARLRLRPILMTSFAFIFGVLPLIRATGAGSEMRKALGVVVFFGMIGVTFFGLFLTPVFFVSIRWVTGKLRGVERGIAH
jgi:hydrophobe/amphiphile efflux-1 (HAE1) family protein